MDLPFIKLQKEIIERQKLSKKDKDDDSNDLVEETWIESLLEKYPDCPNPTNFPRAALYYLINRKKP